MRLTVRDTATLLEVPESTVRKYILEWDLPAEDVDGTYRINASELLEWATIRKVHISPTIFQKMNGESVGPMELLKAIQRGGIVAGIAARDKAAVLEAAVEGMPLPESFDRQGLLQLLLAREAMGSTVVGDGIAIPHPRYPMVLPVGKALVRLCLLAEPLPAAGTGGSNVDTLFVMVCPTVRSHLQLLARLACVLRDTHFCSLLKRRAGADEILQSIERLEATLEPGTLVEQK